MQRVFDVASSIIGLVILMPLFAVVAALIKVQDGGSVFYRPQRVGLNGRLFRVYKFRTMVQNADTVGIGITRAGDDRITNLGRFLRETKIDELPQLFNVLLGDMALVGPRPEDARYVDLYTNEQQEILRVRPGITSPASLVFRNEAAYLAGFGWENDYVKKILPAKLLIELSYVRTRSLQGDLAIIMKTIGEIIFTNRILYRLVLGVRNRHIFVLDLTFFCFVPFLALILRVENIQEWALQATSLALYTVAALIWKFAIFFPTGLYDKYWRYASVDELASVALATFSSALVGVMIFFAFLRPLGVVGMDFPRSIPFVDALLTTLFVGSGRFLLRLLFELHERKERKLSAIGRKKVLIVGAGVAGSMIVKEMKTNPQLGLEPVGFLDDDPRKQNVRIHGVPVLGMLPNLPRLAEEHKAKEIIIAMPTADGKTVRDVVQMCKEAKMPSKIIPGIFEILDGTAEVAQIRDVEIEDLLRRGVVRTDTEGVANLIKGARVMVTGAGGSIGSELCRQISNFEPDELILVGHGETSIFPIASELRYAGSPTGKGQIPVLSPLRIHSVIADVRDRERMRQVFQLHRPTVVFHAAAHKHVGLMEENIPDAVTNNVLGTQVLLDLADQLGVERFVMISSDKAVNPTCMMGVTKRVAELIVHDAAERTGKAFVSVRFGNVLGSRGSVVPIFKQQIARGGPLCITHPDVKRYFMTIPEAVQLVLQAATMGDGGEVFVLDMGEPIRILDLARDLIRLSGFEEGRDIEIVYTGLQRGEKITEELFFDAEEVECSYHEKILVCRSGFNTSLGSFNDAADRRTKFGTEVWAETGMRVEVEHLIAAAQNGATKNVKILLKKIVPEYQENIAIPEIDILTLKRDSKSAMSLVEDVGRA